MKPRRTNGSGSHRLLLLSLLGLSTFCAQLLDASEHNNVTAEKPGTCPVTASGTCTTQCQSDTDCGGNQKCCPSGCGMSCQTPDEENKGCPMFKIKAGQPCRRECDRNQDCRGGGLCCRYGCGKICWGARNAAQ